MAISESRESVLVASTAAVCSARATSLTASGAEPNPNPARISAKCTLNVRLTAAEIAVLHNVSHDIMQTTPADFARAATFTGIDIARNMHHGSKKRHCSATSDLVTFTVQPVDVSSAQPASATAAEQIAAAANPDIPVLPSVPNVVTVPTPGNNFLRFTDAALWASAID
eukprot:1188505-Rhodomonas_salina.1